MNRQTPCHDARMDRRRIDRSFKNGNPAAKLAKLGQLTRVSPLPSKAIFAGSLMKEAVSLLWQMLRQQPHMDIYEPLLFRLKCK
jgi:hypothetical protein